MPKKLELLPHRDEPVPNKGLCTIALQFIVSGYI
jgi:hypothetical protein